MDKQSLRSPFMYTIPLPCTPPKVSSRNNIKADTAETKQERAKRSQDEWLRYAAPVQTSTHFPPPEASGIAKTRKQHARELSQETSDEVVTCTPGLELDNAAPRRCSSRLVGRAPSKGGSSRSESIDFTIRMLESNIHKNREHIHAIKERRGQLTRRISELSDQVHSSNTEIRAIESTNMQLETQSELLKEHVFERNRFVYFLIFPVTA